MHAVVFLCINQQTKYEVLRFTDSKDMTGGQYFKKRHVTLTTPLLGWFIDWCA